MTLVFQVKTLFELKDYVNMIFVLPNFTTCIFGYFELLKTLNFLN